MSAHRLGQEVQTDLQPLMEFRDEVVRQYHEFSEFSFLYYRPEARIHLLNAVAKHFFGELFHVMLDRLVLGVSKLTDPAGSGDRACLSFDYVHSKLSQDNRYPISDADVLLTRAGSVRQNLSRWRSKLIAHKDASVALGYTAAGDVIPGRIKEFYEIAQEYLDLVFDRFGLGPCPVSTPGVHGADELVKVLKYGMAFKQLLDDDPQNYDSYLRASKFNSA